MNIFREFFTNPLKQHHKATQPRPQTNPSREKDALHSALSRLLDSKLEDLKQKHPTVDEFIRGNFERPESTISKMLS